MEQPLDKAKIAFEAQESREKAEGLTQGHEDNVADIERQDQHPITQNGVPFSVWSHNEKKLIIFTRPLLHSSRPSLPTYITLHSTELRGLKVSGSLINLSITTYMASDHENPSQKPKKCLLPIEKVFQGLATAFVGEFSDNAGRRPAYLVCGLLYIAAKIGLALQNSYAGLRSTSMPAKRREQWDGVSDLRCVAMPGHPQNGAVMLSMLQSCRKLVLQLVL